MRKKQKNIIQFRNDKLLESSIETYSYAIKSYLKYLESNNLSKRFNIKNIRKWLANYRNPATYNLKLQSLKEYYYKHFENNSKIQQLTMRQTFEKFKRAKICRAITDTDYLTKKQVEHIVNKVTPRMACIISAFFWTGCRISELLNIQLKDCKEGEYISIRTLGKGFKERVVYLPVIEYKKIIRVFESKTYLFETKQGDKFKRDYIGKEIKRQVLTKCGLNIHPHTLRHSKAMFLRDNNVSTDLIAKALGHSDVSTTCAFYLHGNPDPKIQKIPRYQKIIKEACNE